LRKVSPQQQWLLTHGGGLLVPMVSSAFVNARHRGLPLAADVAVGWRHPMADRAMRATSLCSLFFNLIGSVGFVALIPFCKRAFASSDASVGLAFGCFAGGAALGSFIAGRAHWPVGRAIVVASFSGESAAQLPVKGGLAQGQLPRNSCRLEDRKAE